MSERSETITQEQFYELASACELIFNRIDRAGLSLTGTPAKKLDKVATWEERAIVLTRSFYEFCDSCGRIYPYLDFGLQILDELEAVGAASTVRVLNQLSDLEDKTGELHDCGEVTNIELQVSGEHLEWAAPIYHYYCRKIRDRDDVLA